MPEPEAELKVMWFVVERFCDLYDVRRYDIDSISGIEISAIRKLEAEQELIDHVASVLLTVGYWRERGGLPREARSLHNRLKYAAERQGTMSRDGAVLLEYAEVPAEFAAQELRWAARWYREGAPSALGFRGGGGLHKGRALKESRMWKVIEDWTFACRTYLRYGSESGV